MQQSLAIIILDIDFFKQYNDAYGHIMGDICLQDVSLVFRKALNRSTDFAARFGGEEFVVLLPAMNEDDVQNVAERIQFHVLDLNIPHQSSKVSSHVNVSIGIVIAQPQSQIDEIALLNCADQALYRAKRSGRNCIIVYNQAD